MYSVSGKRHKRPATQADIQHVGKRGRPFKSPSASQQSQRWSVAQLRKYHQNRQLPEPGSGTLSLLERLPTELLQQVFFHSLEVNLPRASQQLALALSNEVTYRVLILFAYFEEDEATLVETKLFLPAIYRSLATEEKVELQAKILSCRWCKLQRLEACLPALCRLQIVQLWHREREAEANVKCQVGEEVPVVVDRSELRPLSKLPGLTDHNELERHFLARWRLPLDVDVEGPQATNSAYLPRVIAWSYDVQITPDDELEVDHGHWYSKSVLAARCFPARLLRNAARSADALDCIQLLRQGAEFLGGDGPMDISKQGLIDGLIIALEARHLKAILTLLELYTSFVKIHPGNATDAGEMSHRPNVSLPPELFHIATRQGKESSNLIWLLIRCGFDSIPFDDDILTGWAVRRKADGDPVAIWLLRRMAMGEQITFEPLQALLHYQGDPPELLNVSGLPAHRGFYHELGYLLG